MWLNYLAVKVQHWAGAGAALDVALNVATELSNPDTGVEEVEGDENGRFWKRE